MTSRRSAAGDDRGGERGAMLEHADPADKAAVYADLGLTLTYKPSERLVLAESRPVYAARIGGPTRTNSYRFRVAARGVAAGRVDRPGESAGEALGDRSRTGLISGGHRTPDRVLRMVTSSRGSLDDCYGRGQALFNGEASMQGPFSGRSIAAACRWLRVPIIAVVVLGTVASPTGTSISEPVPLELQVVVDRNGGFTIHVPRPWNVFLLRKGKTGSAELAAFKVQHPQFQALWTSELPATVRVVALDPSASAAAPVLMQISAYLAFQGVPIADERPNAYLSAIKLALQLQGAKDVTVQKRRIAGEQVVEAAGAFSATTGRVTLYDTEYFVSSRTELKGWLQFSFLTPDDGRSSSTVQDIIKSLKLTR